MTNVLQKLAQANMLGCEDEQARAALAARGLDAPDPESAVLFAAALAGVGLLGGRIPLELEASAGPAPVSAQAHLTEEGADLFRRFLASDHWQLLHEFMLGMAARGAVVPPETLPDLLGRAMKDADLKAALLPVLGARGAWLAEQNPAWAFARQYPPQTAWQEGDFDARLRALKAVRAADPEKGRAWVEAAWEGDAPEHRAAFLTAFESGLSMADAPFLETCLKDSRQEVRRAAADLLVRLPESSFVSLMWGHARTALGLQEGMLKKPALTVNLAENLPQVIKFYGLEPLLKTLTKGKSQRHIGLGAGQLAQLLSFVPPSFWRRQFGKSPQALIDLALASDWAKPLLIGWLLAARNTHDQQWGQVFLHRWTEDTQFRLLLSQFPMAEIQQILDLQQIETIVTATTLLKGRRPAAGYPLLPPLCAMRRPWPVKLARIMIQGFQEMAAGETISAAAYLPEAAYRVPPEMAAEIAAGWPPKPPKVTWKKNIGKFTRLLDLRREMHRYLTQI